MRNAPREDIDELIDTTLASDEEKAALHLFSSSLQYRVAAHWMGGEQRTA